MQSNTAQRIGGAVLMAIGISGTAFSWSTVLMKNSWLKLVPDFPLWRQLIMFLFFCWIFSFIFPIFTSLGLSIILYPRTKVQQEAEAKFRAETMAKYGSRQQKRARKEISKHFWKLAPFGQKLIIMIGNIFCVLELLIFHRLFLNPGESILKFFGH